MGRGKKRGVVLILAGFCIPMLAMLFTSDYNSGDGFIWNVKNNKIDLWERTYIVEKTIFKTSDIFDTLEPTTGKIIPAGSVKLDPVTRTQTIYLPYSLFFGLGIILTAIGIGFVVISKDERGRSTQKEVDG